MGKTRERLVDATKRLLSSGTGEDEATKSIVEIGIGKAEAKSIVNEAKALLDHESPKKQDAKSSESFWDAPVGTYFDGVKREEGGHRHIFSFLKWLAK